MILCNYGEFCFDALEDGSTSVIRSRRTHLVLGRIRGEMRKEKCVLIAKKVLVVANILLLSFFISAFMARPVYASPKSLYVIADIDVYPTPIWSYDIQPADTYLVFQASYNISGEGMGAVGLGIDDATPALFVTYEGFNVIELINATTMQSMGNTTAPGASNLAGIAYDRGAKKVYTVDRNTNKLYVYNWNPATTTLSLLAQVNLTDVSKAHGLALDDVADLLYVGDNVATNNIRVFNTADWSPNASYTVSQAVQGIAVDTANGFIYTGCAVPDYGSLGLLCKYDMNNDTETSVNIRTLPGAVTIDNVVGLAVDQNTGLLYITTGNQYGGGLGGSDRIMVFNSSLTLLNCTSDIGNPTGIAIPIEEVGYNPLGLSKTDAPDPVTPGGTITYTLSFDNLLNNFTVNNVVIVDALPPETTFVSASGGGTYYAITHEVTWNIGTLPAGAPPQTLTLVVTVEAGTTNGTILDNAATIDSDQTPPTTKHAYTQVIAGSSIPVGGYSVSLTKQVSTVQLASYTMLSALFGAALIVLKRKKHRK